MPSLFERCDGCSGYGHISDPWNFGAQYCADCWRRLKAHRTMMVECESGGRNLATALFGVAFAAREIAICAATRLPDGRVFRGHRHNHSNTTAKRAIVWNGGVDPGIHHWSQGMDADQGFITSRNRYVGREEALRLQLAAGIPSACPSGYRVRELFSEDLY